MFSGFVDAVRRWPVLSSVALTAIVSAPFVLFPGIDLAVSRTLFIQGEGFGIIHRHVLDVLRYAKQAVLAVLCLWILASIFVPLLVTGRCRRLMPPRDALFLLTSLALGPGILVGDVLKDNWGRARPRQLIEFGGKFDFSPAWEIGSQCVKNCSFVSGEAASAMWFAALVVLVPAAWRLHAVLGAFGLAVLVSFARMLAGAHFLSDVTIAWCLTLAVIAICHGVFYRWFGLDNDNVDAWFTRARGFLQAPFRLVFGAR